LIRARVPRPYKRYGWPTGSHQSSWRSSAYPAVLLRFIGALSGRWVAAARSLPAHDASRDNVRPTSTQDGSPGLHTTKHQLRTGLLDARSRTGLLDARSPRDARRTGLLETPTGPIRLYSDLLLHDMGEALRDGFTQFEATGQDWRTAPLGLRSRSRYLHDGRAATLDEAIRAHDGEAQGSVTRYTSQSAFDREALFAFLGTL